MATDGLQFKTEWYIGKFDDPMGEIERATHGGLDEYGNEVPGMDLFDAIETFKDNFKELEHVHGNLATTVGIQALIYWMCNGAGGGAQLPSAPSPSNLFNNANARLMVGTGIGAAAQTDTYSTFTSAVYKAMDSGYPNMSAATPWVVTWQATFGSSDANQAWNEFAVANAASTPVILNRVVSAKGTKASGETWVLQLAITVA